MNQLPAVAETNQPPMRAETVARDPAENTAAALSSLQRLGCNVALRTRTEFPENGSWREVITGAAVEISDTADLAACRRIVAAMMAPASIADTGKWLAELSLVSARKATGDDESAALIAAYHDRLKAYPGDVVRETLKSWRGKWFPTWGELADILDGRIAGRRAIVAAIQNHEMLAKPAPKVATVSTADPDKLQQQIWDLEDRASALRAGTPRPTDRNCPRGDMRQRADDLEEEAYTLKAKLKGAA